MLQLSIWGSFNAAPILQLLGLNTKHSSLTKNQHLPKATSLGWPVVWEMAQHHSTPQGQSTLYMSVTDQITQTLSRENLNGRHSKWVPRLVVDIPWVRSSKASSFILSVCESCRAISEGLWFSNWNTTTPRRYLENVCGLFDENRESRLERQVSYYIIRVKTSTLA